MDILEAYNETLAAAQDLRQYGIDVQITPILQSEVEDGDRLPRDKWVEVTFSFKTKAQAEFIKRRADELGAAGIVFDTGGTKGERDWAIDWSFDVNPSPDTEWQARREDVEKMISRMGGRWISTRTIGSVS